MFSHKTHEIIFILIFVAAVSFLTECKGACDADEFQCRRGECIPDVWKCDGDRDCSNGKDERKCPLVVCSEYEHQCYDNGFSHCIPLTYTCDGDPDCGDRSDEDPAICRRPRPRT